MNSSIEIKKKFEKVFDKRQATVLTEVIIDAYSEIVKTGDFNELKGIVKDIGIKVGELAEAQRESQKEISRLDKSIQELAEAQKRTEIKVEELAEAQKRTEISIDKLVGRVEGVEERLEGVSNSVGYSLEDKSFKALPSLLEKEGVKIVGRIIRRY